MRRHRRSVTVAAAALVAEHPPEDVFFKKLVTFKHRGQQVTFRVAQELFSSHEVDTGTQRLLRTLLDTEVGASRTVLDLGCGYGPIGLTLKRFDAGRVVHLVDRDALALAYCRQNARLNGLEPVAVYGSLGYADVTAVDFDLIVANIPAKAGERAITTFLRDARRHLAPGGSVAVVVVSRLEALVDGVLDAPEIEVLDRKTWPGHTVYRYRYRVVAGAAPLNPPNSGGTYEAAPLNPPDSGGTRGTWPASPPELGGWGADPADAVATDLYRRETVTWRLGKEALRLDLAHDLSDLDSRQAELLIERLARQSAAPDRAVIFNPGQGRVALAVWQLLRPAAIVLADRDLLRLRFTQANLIQNGCPDTVITLQHQVGLPADGAAPATLIAGVLRDDERPEAQAALLRQAALRLAPAGTLLLGGSATALTRAETALRADGRLKIVERKRKRGAGLLAARGG